MRKALTTLCATILALLNLSSISAQDKVTFTPAWLPQSQFAGFYAAKENGFFEDEGLDVTIKHTSLNSKKSCMECLRDGEADIISAMSMQAILARDSGLMMKNVLQMFQSSAMIIISKEPIHKVSELNGKTMGIWKKGFHEICELCCRYNNIQVEWVPFTSGINLCVAGAIDATVAMSYNEYYSLLEAVGEIPQDHILRFKDIGFDIPEDGLYVTEEYLKDHKSEVERFCRATRRGWDWCRKNQEKALDIVMKYVEDFGISTNRYHQKQMLKEILDLLINPVSGEMDYEQMPQDVFDTLIKMMVELNYISKPVTYNEFCR